MRKYIWKRLLRNIKGSVIVLLLGAALTLLLVLLVNTRDRQQSKLADVYKSMEINCTVTSLDGIRTSDLMISGGPLNALTYPGYGISEFVSDPVFHLTLNAEFGFQSDLFVVASNRLDTIPALLPENGVRVDYKGKHRASDFQGDEAIVIISSNLIEQYEFMGEPLGDTITVSIVDNSMNYRSFGSSFASVFPVELELTVAGVAMGGSENYMYIPFECWQRIVDERALNLTRYTESFSFVLSDNSRLAEFKEKALEYFREPDLSLDGRNNMYYSLLVNDALFISTVNGLNRDINLYAILIPFACVFCVVIGFLSGLLGANTRKRELAVMRSMGTPRGRIFLFMLGEQAILSFAGALLGAAFSLPLVGITVRLPLLVGVCVSCFVAGTAAIALRLTSQSTMEVLKVKE